MKLEFVAKRRQKEKELANANFALRLDNEPEEWIEFLENITFVNH